MPFSPWISLLSCVFSHFNEPLVAAVRQALSAVVQFASPKVLFLNDSSSSSEPLSDEPPSATGVAAGSLAACTAVSSAPFCASTPASASVVFVSSAEPSAEVSSVAAFLLVASESEVFSSCDSLVVFADCSVCCACCCVVSSCATAVLAVAYPRPPSMATATSAAMTRLASPPLRTACHSSHARFILSPYAAPCGARLSSYGFDDLAVVRYRSNPET